MNGTLKFTAHKLTIPGVLFLTYILYIILLIPAIKA